MRWSVTGAGGGGEGERGWKKDERKWLDERKQVGERARLARANGRG